MIARSWKGYSPRLLSNAGIQVERHDFWVRDAITNECRLMTDAEWDADMCDTPPPPAQEPLSLHRCKVCGTRWLLWPDAVHGGGWNLLDRWQRPASCCDNVPMGEQIEHLRDIPLTVSAFVIPENIERNGSRPPVGHTPDGR
jgi:hypothetical protein